MQQISGEKEQKTISTVIEKIAVLVETSDGSVHQVNVTNDEGTAILSAIRSLKEAKGSLVQLIEPPLQGIELE